MECWIELVVIFQILWSIASVIARINDNNNNIKQK